MHELGVLDDFLKRPHQEVREIGGDIDGTRVTVADFTHLPTRCKFVALMPQWEFLDFLADEARRMPDVPPLHECGVVGLRKSGGTITGVEVHRTATWRSMRRSRSAPTGGARLCGNAPGWPSAHSRAPIDVLWMRLSRRDTDRADTLGVIRPDACS